jgi:hypothetical protein
MNDNTIIELAALVTEAVEQILDENYSYRGKALTKLAAKIRALKQPEPQAIRSKPRGLQEPAPAEPPGSPTVREEDDPAPINSILGKRTEHGVHYSADDAAPKRRKCYTVWSQEGKLILAEATKVAVRRLTTMVLLDSDITRMVELRPGERIVSGGEWRSGNFPKTDVYLLRFEHGDTEADRYLVQKCLKGGTTASNWLPVSEIGAGPDHTALLRRVHETLSHIAEHCPQDGTRRMAAGEAEQIATAVGIGG